MIAPHIDSFDNYALWFIIKCPNPLCVVYDKHYYKNSLHYRGLSSNSLALIALSQWNKDVQSNMSLSDTFNLPEN